MRCSTLLGLVAVTLAAPLSSTERDDIIAGKYIVKLKEDISTAANEALKASIANSPDFEYMLPGFRGFAGTLSEEEVAKLESSAQVSHQPS